jgi:hypothetical protein
LKRNYIWGYANKKSLNIPQFAYGGLRISTTYSSQDGRHYLLSCDTVNSRRNTEMFRKNISVPSSAPNSLILREGLSVVYLVEALC